MVKIPARLKKFLHISSKSEETDEYLLLGLPNSGKTVFFCMCVNLLQHKFNKLDGYSVVYSDDFIGAMPSSLREQGKNGWPKNTAGIKSHKIAITDPDNGVRSIDFMDCSGKTFIDAFGADHNGEANASADAEKNQTVVELKEAVNKSKGVFLIIDAAGLKDARNEQLTKCLFNLFPCDNSGVCSYKGKLAVVVTKGDLVKDMEISSVQDAFEKQQPNFYAMIKGLKKMEKYFLVTAVDCDIDENGDCVPPLDYTPSNNSKGICEPLEWMLDIEPKK